MGTETRVQYLILQPPCAYYALVNLIYPKPKPKPYPESQTVNPDQTQSLNLNCHIIPQSK